MINFWKRQWANLKTENYFSPKNYSISANIDARNMKFGQSVYFFTLEKRIRYKNFDLI